MTRKVTFIQRKMLKVHSPGRWITGNGMAGEEIPERIYFEEEYTTDERAQELLKQAEKLYVHGSWREYPEIEVYWETLSKTVEEIE